MAAYETITAEQALRDLQDGALLVNGYDNEESWEGTRVPGALFYPDFLNEAARLPRNTEIMFYCA